ncbi:keto-deoxy-phosphogluconate aldolase [Shewanella sp. Choline-02u-19]|jgi:2-dehydro-3-deoxyphosphogluconate aldolase/(4S)-4-hydroxy-2-oxoglutarate aldolase|uniref:bifunctional 4-hydroxy-2-oxoglutarate aldolase/2-dehydro-3-deoxy-phosphogluconate aldolase n=1 Tax=Shewanella TaxID=22 RepID=UPI000C3333B6|nr:MULTISPECIES: bifunctional 4-hydroxy-2-oxoglutarate aldolase/2-dehydro-3-deoxy-phosphogluconate aldolase [Shewanella]MCL1059192.1 bifunctional 4-hydroxy-2-oxoglutarate aldolase/2-dehydro-3-deoxy-phosphogluconate aldolase [Shewanella gelidimarina]PKG74297.1 keto-deoxy-phosphogluconate aldolase [Shewanella sp. GutCb]PKH55950.1 keto-deoxy-phosphogluconate aldolase [Shewanella sp. Bg11-22]PKI27396.1 keto-deoxy-phosphogluconate aldolase [Shewanella sp. Choline-02u-19]
MLENNWLIQPQDIFDRSPIVPVMVINKIEHAVPLARALVAGGISVLEVTLRTDCALEAISKIAKEVPEALVGAGTILNEVQLAQAVKAGAQFVITPGATTELLKAAMAGTTPLIPGVASISEVMAGMELGYKNFKFFPAEASGGVNALKAFSGPLADIRFCPTGGITPSSYKDYLALKNVDCIGGSWIAPTDAMEQGDWGRITALCKEAISAL